MTCPIANPKSTLRQIPCTLKAPVKTNTKTPTAKTYSQGNPSSSLKVITGGKAQTKPVAKSGTIVLSEDKIQAQPKPVAKVTVKKAQAKKFIDDFGMIQVAKMSGKDMKTSIWGRSPLPSLSGAKHRQGKH